MSQRIKTLFDVQILAFYTQRNNKYMVELKKPKGSSLIPYKITNGKIYVFLQQRTKNAPRYPGFLGLFGGSAKNEENTEDTLIREIDEELKYIPKKHILFGEYYYDGFYPLSAFIEKIDENFQDRVTVCEGDGGLFICLDDLNNYSITPVNLIVLRDFHSRQLEFLKNTK